MNLKLFQLSANKNQVFPFQNERALKNAPITPIEILNHSHESKQLCYL